MNYRYGRRVIGRTRIALKSVLTDSIPGKKYQLVIDTSTIPDVKKKETFALLKDKLETPEWRIEILYAEVGDNRITLQIVGSPFAWALLIAFLPEILSLLGISVIAIAAFFIIESLARYWAQIAILILVSLGGLAAWSHYKGKEMEKR